MSSIRNQIVQAVVAVLNGEGKPANFAALRYSLIRLDFDKKPDQLVVIVHPAKDDPDRATKGQQVLKRTVLVQLDVYGKGDPIDENIDPVLCWITKAMTADQSLGGLALDVREGPAEWDEEMASEGIGFCRVFFEVDYIHNRNNQESLT